MYCGALAVITLFVLSALIAFNVGLLNCYQKVCIFAARKRTDRTRLNKEYGRWCDCDATAAVEAVLMMLMLAVRLQ